MVAPLVGAWIEITVIVSGLSIVAPSLLSWERGLKSKTDAEKLHEIGRSSRGSVD